MLNQGEGSLQSCVWSHWVFLETFCNEKGIMHQFTKMLNSDSYPSSITSLLHFSSLLYHFFLLLFLSLFSPLTYYFWYSLFIFPLSLYSLTFHPSPSFSPLPLPLSHPPHFSLSPFLCHFPFTFPPSLSLLSSLFSPLTLLPHFSLPLTLFHHFSTLHFDFTPSLFHPSDSHVPLLIHVKSKDYMFVLYPYKRPKNLVDTMISSLFIYRCS